LEKIGQAEIIDCLKKHKVPIARAQIAKETGYNPIKVSHLIKRLLINKEVKCTELDRHQSARVLGMDRPFRRTRFYYV